MEEKTTKADRWIDFLVPWHNAYYFKTRRMQTSIKVVILMPLILALLYRAMCIADKFIDETLEKPCVRDPRSPSAVDPRKQV